MREAPLHPILNKDSAGHYDIGKTSAIEELEKELSIREAIGFCKANCFKYEFRQDHRGQKESDIRKIATYKAYQKELQRLILDGVDSDISVANGWKARGKEWRFR